jgi:DNA-binding transcriptional MerR regulator
MFKTKKDVSVADTAAVKTQGAPGEDGAGYSSGEVAKIAGVSLRQLQWWDERSVVSPRQQGHRRMYLPEEVVEVSVIAELRRKGFSLQKIRRVLRFLQREMGKRLADAVAGNTDMHLITDGKNIFLEDKPGRVINVLKNATQPMFLVCVTDQLRRLQNPAPVPAARKPARSERAGSSPARAKLG